MAARDARGRALLLRLVGVRLRRGQADAIRASTALKEEDAYPAMPEDGYGWEKLFSERMCRHFREDFGLATRVARYHNVYGPHGTCDGGREKAPAAICRKVDRGEADRAARDRDLGRRRADPQLHVHRRLRARHAGDHGSRTSSSRSTSAVSELVTINQLVDIVEDIAGMTARAELQPRRAQGRARSQQRQHADPAGASAGSRRSALRDGLERDLRLDLRAARVAGHRVSPRAAESEPRGPREATVESRCRTRRRPVRSATGRTRARRLARRSRSPSSRRASATVLGKASGCGAVHHPAAPDSRTSLATSPAGFTAATTARPWAMKFMSFEGRLNSVPS